MRYEAPHSHPQQDGELRQRNEAEQLDFLCDSALQRQTSPPAHRSGSAVTPLLHLYLYPE